MHKQYELEVLPGETFTSHILDVGGDLASLWNSDDRHPAVSGVIYFNKDVSFKLNWEDSEPINLDSTLMAGRFEFAYGDTIIDKMLFGVAGETTNVNIILFG